MVHTILVLRTFFSSSGGVTESKSTTPLGIGLLSWKEMPLPKPVRAFPGFVGAASAATLLLLVAVCSLCRRSLASRRAAVDTSCAVDGEDIAARSVLRSGQASSTSASFSGGCSLSMRSAATGMKVRLQERFNAGISSVWASRTCSCVLQAVEQLRQVFHVQLPVRSLPSCRKPLRCVPVDGETTSSSLLDAPLKAAAHRTSFSMRSVHFCMKTYRGNPDNSHGR